MSLESTIPDRFLDTVALELEIISRLTLSAIIISNAQSRVACLGGCINYRALQASIQLTIDQGE